MARRLLDLVYAPLAVLIFVPVTLLVCLTVICLPTLALRREAGRLGVRLMMASIGIPVRVRGLEHLPAGPAVVVSNHASYVDGIVLTAVLPRRYTFVVKDDAAAWPFVGTTIKRMGVAFINREEARSGAKQTRALIRRLQDGDSLAVFAEGTFVAEPGVLSFKTGAFLMAVRAGVPVVPCGIRGSRRFFGGGSWIPRWSPLDIELGPPIHPTSDDRDAALVLRDTARRQVIALSGEPDHAHRSHGAHV